MKLATGVPMPKDELRADIVGRRVCVCLYDMEAKRGYVHRALLSDPSQCAGLTAAAHSANPFVGNMHTVHAVWSPEEEDRWQFSKAATRRDDRSFVMRTDWPARCVRRRCCLPLPATATPSRRTTGCSVSPELKLPVHWQRLHLLFELIVSVRRNCPRGGTTVVDMSCGWAAVRLAELADTQTVRRLVMPLQGGTPAGKETIRQEDVRQRRTGWREVAKGAQACRVVRAASLLTLVPGRQPSVAPMARSWW